MASFITAGNATNGLQVSSDNTGILQLKTGTGAGTTALTLDASQNATFAGTVTAPTGTLYPIVSGTAVASTSGTSIDFTGIPSWVKRITVMFNGVSTNGVANYLIQLGSGSFVTTGYVSASSILEATTTTTAYTAGIGIRSNSASAVNNGIVLLTNITGNTWCAQGTLSITTSTTGTLTVGGSVALSGTLDRVRITTINGTDTFDAGSINILYE